MADVRINLYEGMFLLQQQAVASDFGGCVEFLKQVFERAEAELIAIRRWDERRMAYPIRGQKRGTYMLAYFRARGSQIANIERDCNLSEEVLRNMITRADHLGETEIDLAKKDAELSLQKHRSDNGEDAKPDEAPEHAAGGDKAEVTESAAQSTKPA